MLLNIIMKGMKAWVPVIYMCSYRLYVYRLTVIGITKICIHMLLEIQQIDTY